MRRKQEEEGWKRGGARADWASNAQSPTLAATGWTFYIDKSEHWGGLVLLGPTEPPFAPEGGKGASGFCFGTTPEAGALIKRAAGLKTWAGLGRRQRSTPVLVRLHLPPPKRPPEWTPDHPAWTLPVRPYAGRPGRPGQAPGHPRRAHGGAGHVPSARRAAAEDPEREEEASRGVGGSGVAGRGARCPRVAKACAALHEKGESRGSAGDAAPQLQRAPRPGRGRGFPEPARHLPARGWAAGLISMTKRCLPGPARGPAFVRIR